MNANKFLSTALLAALIGVMGYAFARGGRTKFAQSSQKVIVANASTAPVPISNEDQEGRNAYNAAFSQYIPKGSMFETITIPTVPVGKRLIITSISLYSSGAANPQSSSPAVMAEIRVKNKSNVLTADHFIVMENNIAGFSPGTIGNQQCFIAVDPTDSATINPNRQQDPPATSTAVNVWGDIEGYLVSVS
jgi:hypothetical protein